MMNLTLRNICVLTLLFAACLTCLAAEEPSRAPKMFRAYIGGFNGPTYLVDFREGVLTYTSGPRGDLKKLTISPSAARWRQFRLSLDTIGVWRWRPDYSSKSVRDGTQWQLEVEYPDHRLKTGGSNSYPEKFEQYRAAVEKLIEGHAFK